MGVSIEACSELLMQGDLHEPSGDPIEGERHKTCQQPWITRTRDDKPRGGAYFKKHERRYDPCDLPRIALMVSHKRLPSDVCEQGILHELNDPDQADERPRRCMLRCEEPSHDHAGAWLSAA